MRYKNILVRSSLLRDTFVYTATDMLGKAMSFLLIPFLSYYLPPEELGIATNFSVLTSILTLLSGLAIVNSVPYFYYEQSRDENSRLVSNLLYLITILCSLFGLAFMLLTKQISEYLYLDVVIQFISVIFVYTSLICQTSLILLRLEEKPNHFFVLQLCQILLHTFLVILFVIWLREGGKGKIVAEMLAFLIMAIIHLVIMRRKRYLGKKIEKKWQKKLISFGLPLLPHSLSFWIKGSTDKIFITSFWGLQVNGLYSMALSISTIYTVLVNSFFNAYTPYLQKRIASLTPQGNNVEKRMIVKQTYIIYGLFFLVAIISIAGSWFVLRFFVDSQYFNSFCYIPYIIISNFIYTFYNFAIEYIYKVKKTLIMGAITLCGSLFQMIISYFLIRDYGALGAVYSLILGTIFTTVGIFLYSNAVYYMPWFSFWKNESGK